MWFESFQARADKIGETVDNWLKSKNYNVKINSLAQTESNDADGYSWVIISFFWEWKNVE